MVEFLLFFLIFLLGMLVGAGLITYMLLTSVSYILSIPEILERERLEKEGLTIVKIKKRLRK